MRIKSIHVEDFKRFTDLKVQEIPETARLIVLVGPNGSGKTSLFEAFNFWIRRAKRDGGISFTQQYHWKISSIEAEKNYQNLYNRMQIEFYNETLTPKAPRGASEKLKKLFYIRSAYRHEASFVVSQLHKVSELLHDTKSTDRLIDSESKVSDNYERIIWNSLAELYKKDNSKKQVADLVEKLIGKIQSSVLRVFTDLTFNGVGEPANGGTFLFNKGVSENFFYENLSGGEKAAFDILLDFIIKIEEFDDTIICLDEPELHMHTKLQANLLEELYQQLPEKCQLWISTHSIGMMRKAMELYQHNPDEVVFLDFGKYDFDTSVVMTPVKVNRQFWKEVFAVAVDDLVELIAPSEIVFCEGKPATSAINNKTFDAEIYRTVFQSRHPQTEFIPLGGHTDIEKNSVLLETVLQKLFDSIKIWSVIDRDDRSDEEIEEKAAKGTKVLRYRDIESYLWCDEVLQKLCEAQGKPQHIATILTGKQKTIADYPYSKDDIKAISGTLYNLVKTTLELYQKGNDAKAFAKVMLAPLITPETQIYKELEQDVFGS